MAQRGAYTTKQRELIHDCLVANTERYLSVDDVCDLLERDGHHVGRSTVYRALEAQVKSGKLAKVVSSSGGVAHYRLMDQGDDNAHGQLVCLTCHKVFPFECSHMGSFSQHVESGHGFALDIRRSVFCGYCPSCRTDKEASA